MSYTPSSPPKLADFVLSQPPDLFGASLPALLAWVNSLTEIGRVQGSIFGNYLVGMQGPATADNPSGIVVWQLINQSLDVAILSLIYGGMPTNPYYPMLKGLTIPPRLAA